MSVSPLNSTNSPQGEGGVSFQLATDKSKAGILHPMVLTLDFGIKKRMIRQLPFSLWGFIVLFSG